MVGKNRVTQTARLAEQIRAAGIIAIIRGDFPLDHLPAVAEALLRGGVSVVEITLNSRAALQGLDLLRGRVGDQMLVGAGTVRTAVEVGQALEAGAQFLVSPNFDPASVARSRGADVLHLPGIFTATEAQMAFAAGCRMVKLFPADALGPAYLKALRAPLNDIEFVPTGGIDANNLADYIKVGAVAFGVGSSLVTNPQQDPAELTGRAAQLVAVLQQAREELSARR
jgi:2-dehydro-3-deoxyphosphogluconate aldolase/(4S)-4-hydroxy-2-oxoglutarate aldolase